MVKRKPKPKLASSLVKRAITTTRHTRASSRLLPNSLRTVTCRRCRKSFASDEWKIHSCAKASTDKKLVPRQDSVSPAPYQHPKLTKATKFICDICQAKCSSAVDLKAHLAEHVNGTVYKCNVCKEIFKTSNEWKEHIQESANTSFCETCGQNFGCITAKDQHRCETEADSPSICIECGVSFKKRWTLFRHLQLHKGESTCPVCNKRFLRLDVHMKIHKSYLPTTTDTNDEDCKVPDTPPSATVIRDKKHRLDETKEKLEGEPQKKGKSLAASSSQGADSLLKPSDGGQCTTINVVRPVNSSVKVRTCKYCFKVCKSRKKLNLHKQFFCKKKSEVLRETSVTEPEPMQNDQADGQEGMSSSTHYVFKCSKCPKSYRHEKQLVLHEKGHKNVNLQHSCKECGRQFWSKSHLLDHENVHVKRELKCDLCPAVVTTSRKLYHHRVRHFGNVKTVTTPTSVKHIYICKHCQNQYGTLKEFEKHCSTFKASLLRHDTKTKTSESDEASTNDSSGTVETNATILEPTEAAELPEVVEERDKPKRTANKKMKTRQNKLIVFPQLEKDTGSTKNLCLSLPGSVVACESQDYSGQKKEKVGKDTGLQRERGSGFRQDQLITKSKRKTRGSSGLNETTFVDQLSGSKREKRERLLPYNVDSDLLQLTAETPKGLDTTDENITDNSTSEANNSLPIKADEFNSSPSSNAPCSKSSNKRKSFSCTRETKNLVAQLLEQIKAKQMITKKPHTCKLCGKVFIQLRGISVHYLRTHTTEDVKNLLRSKNIVEHKDTASVGLAEDDSLSDSNLNTGTIQDVNAEAGSIHEAIPTTRSRKVSVSIRSVKKDPSPSSGKTRIFWEVTETEPKPSTKTKGAPEETDVMGAGLIPGSQALYESSTRVSKCFTPKSDKRTTLTTKISITKGKIAASQSNSADDESRSLVSERIMSDSGEKFHETQVVSGTEAVIDANTSDLQTNSPTWAWTIGEEARLLELRNNFSKLFCHLVGDEDVLTDLGWPERQIDEVLVDVIARCDQAPYSRNESKLDSLRGNISILLRICIKEQAMQNFGWNSTLVDDVVKEMLAGGNINC